MRSINSSELFDAMKEELKSMDHNQVWNLVELSKGSKELDVSGSFKPSMTQMTISNHIRVDVLPKVSHRRIVLIAKTPFLLYQKMTH